MATLQQHCGRRALPRTRYGSWSRRAVVGLGLLGLAGCTEPGLVLSYGDGTTTVVFPQTSDDDGDSDTLSTDEGFDSGTDTIADPCGPDGTECTFAIDLLFVIDNSGTMGEEQLNLARNFPLLIEQLEALEGPSGNAAAVDVNVMVTTTDFGNPECSGQWVHPDYEPAAGRPISSPCTDRLARFEDFGEPPLVIAEACTDVCNAAAPAFPTDQFIHFTSTEHNVVGGTPADALACIGPQGIDGCGFEGTLESMAQALDPSTCWNDPANCTDPEFAEVDKPFLRDGAVLAIAIITDEADCSVQQFSVMQAETFMADDPDTLQPALSSALCWNAGVVCSDLDPETGEYAGCIAADKGVDGSVGVPPGDPTALHPLGRYRQLLDGYRAQGKEILMLGVLGVPEVTARAENPPYEPVAGGVADLVYRQWRDDDVLPAEVDAGTRAVDKEFEFGIGPGCTGTAEDGTFTGQAIPPVRIREVCESLNIEDDPLTAVNESKTRCCIESICDDDFSPAIRCLTDLIQNVFTPVG